MNLLKKMPNIRNIWNKLNTKQKKLLLAMMLSTTALGTVGCSNKDVESIEFVYDDSNIDENKINELAKKYGFHPEQIEVISPCPGDTLTSLAEEYGMSLQEIIEINGIENPDFITPEMSFIVVSNHKRTNYDSQSFSEKINNQGYTKGIDISAVGQGKINLKNVLEQNDIDFVMARMSYFIKQSDCDANRDGIDDVFDKYVQACADANVPMGVYFWPSIVDVKSAKREVDIIINKLEEIKEKYGLCLEMPVCIDIELKKDGGGDVIKRLCAGDQNSIDALEYVINTLEEKGYYVMIYTGNNCLDDNPKYKALIESLNVDTWIPKYNSSRTTDFNSVPDVSMDDAYNGRTSIRQYTQRGKVEGYNGLIDLDVCYTDFPKIIKDNGLNGFDKLKEYNLN